MVPERIVMAAVLSLLWRYCLLERRLFGSATGLCGGFILCGCACSVWRLRRWRCSRHAGGGVLYLCCFRALILPPRRDRSVRRRRRLVPLHRWERHHKLSVRHCLQSSRTDTLYGASTSHGCRLVAAALSVLLFSLPRAAPDYLLTRGVSCMPPHTTRQRAFYWPA